MHLFYGHSGRKRVNRGVREDERGSEKGKNTKERKERRLKKKGKKTTERKERRLKKERKEGEPIYENTRIRNSKNPEWRMYIRRNRKQNVRDEGESQFRRLEKSLALCLLFAFIPNILG